MAAPSPHWTKHTARFLLLASLAALLLFIIPPWLAKLHPLWDFFSGFRVQVFALGLTICLAAAVTRWRRALLLPLAAVLTSFSAFDVLRIAMPEPRPAAGNAGRNLRLLAFNVLHGNQRSTEVREFVTRENPDFAAFFEADRHWPEALAPLRETLPYHLPYAQFQFQVFSRYPLTVRHIRPIGVNRGDIVLTVHHPDGPLTVIPSHAYPQLHFGGPGYEHRNTQLQRSIANGLGDSPRPLVLLGDLNVSPWSPYFREMLAASGLHDARRGSWPSPTQSKISPAWIFGIPIDHCLVSDTVRVDRFRIGPHLGSDHRPLIVDIAF